MHEVTQFEGPLFKHKAGERIGKYLLEKPIGCGGFAEVWRAVDSGTNRSVALKIFFDRVIHDPTIWRAIREEPTKQPEHDRIVPIYYCHLDSDDGMGPYYVVMKLMTGGTLEELLQRRVRLPAPEAITIIRDVVAALDFAHNSGIIHRDLKPTNILFDAHGRAALADFGIAKDLNKSSASTVFGGVVGTVAYMSPEQGEGLPVTRASDIYSLGTVFYEMLVGKLPYNGPTDTAILIARSRQDPPPPRSMFSDVPDKVEAVVMKMLARDPANRYGDCHALLAGLDWAMAPSAAPAQPQTRVAANVTPSSNQPRASTGKFLGLAALAVAAIGGGAFWMTHKSTPAVADDLSTVDWKTAAYNDRHFSDCQSSSPCLERKAHADELQKTNWETVRYDNALLLDCMSYQQCEAKKQMADRLTASKNWSASADCMGFAPCEDAKRKPPADRVLPTAPVTAKIPKKRTDDQEDGRQREGSPQIFEQTKRPQ